MTASDAKKIIRSFYDNGKRKDQENGYIEALQFLIETTKDPRAMLELGGHYYEQKNFELALKYYEMADSFGDRSASMCLGYIWYYGRTGEKNYEKAFHYYSRSMERGDLIAVYKIADMYRNGYYVEKDLNKYREMIEDLYPMVQYDGPDSPVIEVSTRLARIRYEDGKTEEALALLRRAIALLKYRINDGVFFGDLSIMKWAINDLYTWTEFNPEDCEFYDLFYAFKKPGKATFLYEMEPYSVEAVEEDGEIHISFLGRWFRTLDDFFLHAEINGNPICFLEREFVDFKLE